MAGLGESATRAPRSVSVTAVVFRGALVGPLLFACGGTGPAVESPVEPMAAACEDALRSPASWTTAELRSTLMPGQDRFVAVSVPAGETCVLAAVAELDGELRGAELGLWDEACARSPNPERHAEARPFVSRPVGPGTWVVGVTGFAGASPAALSLRVEVHECVAGVVPAADAPASVVAAGEAPASVLAPAVEPGARVREDAEASDPGWTGPGDSVLGQSLLAPPPSDGSACALAAEAVSGEALPAGAVRPCAFDDRLCPRESSVACWCDALGRVVTRRRDTPSEGGSSAPSWWRIRYDRAGRLALLQVDTFGAGDRVVATRRYFHDGAGRIVGIVDRGFGDALVCVRYQLDERGRVASSQSAIRGGPLARDYEGRTTYVWSGGAIVASELWDHSAQLTGRSSLRCTYDPPCRSPVDMCVPRCD